MKRQEGELYREGLVELAESLGVGEHVTESDAVYREVADRTKAEMAGMS